MSTKTRLIEKINKRMDMISESLPSPLTFTESEVMQILWEIEGVDLSPKSGELTQEEINEIYADKQIITSKFKITEAYQNACKKKGRYFGPDTTPKGAFN